MIKDAKKMAAIVLAVSLMLAGCGGKEESVLDSADTDLGSNVSNETSVENTDDETSEVEADSTEMQDTEAEDPVLEWISTNGGQMSMVESTVRAELGVAADEDIRRSDVENITEMDFFPMAEEISDWANLPNLKVLKADGLYVENLDLLADLPGLTELTLTGCGNLTDISGLANLPDLTVLNLSGCSKVADISVLASLPKLTQLSLNGGREITDINVLAGLKSLKAVDISNIGTNDIGVLSELPELVDLTITGPEMFGKVSEMPNLEVLNMQVFYGESEVQQYDFEVLAGLSKLAKLSLSYVNASNSNIDDVPMLPSLESLELTFCNDLDSLLRSAPNLKELSLISSGYENQWDALASLTKLETITLDGGIPCDFSALDGSESLKTFIVIGGSPWETLVSGITNWPNLTRLELRGGGFEEIFGDSEFLKNVPNLKELYYLCHDDGVSNSINISSLAYLKNLTSLQLSCLSTGVTELDVSVLSELTNLTELNLDIPNIETVDLSPLSQLSNLTMLKLRTQAEADLSCLSGLGNLKSIDLSFCWGINDISALSGLTGLETLDLRYTSVTDYSSVSFVPDLKHD